MTAPICKYETVKSHDTVSSHSQMTVILRVMPEQEQHWGNSDIFLNISSQSTWKHKPLTWILNNFKAGNQLLLTQQASQGKSVCCPLCLRTLQWTSATWHHLQGSVTTAIRHPHNLLMSECAGGCLYYLIVMTSAAHIVPTLESAWHCCGIWWRDTNTQNTHPMLLLVRDWCSQSHDPGMSRTVRHKETESPQCQPEAPSLSMQRQTVVFHSQRALKNQMYASLEKPH